MTSSEATNSKNEKPVGPNFIHQIIDKDLKEGKNNSQVVTRFPPEPNGYLHIGHTKSICLNFSTAEKYNGVCHLRFDDTNPDAEDMEYVEAIQEDIKWLGFDWKDKLFYASDYFENIYKMAVQLIECGKAYVCNLSPEEMKFYRGTLTEPGKNSPNRDLPVSENLRIFEEMRKGVHPEGSYVLRAKIDMTSPNMNLRDPAIYRIRKTHHQRTGDQWCIYPLYDFTHCLSDSFEGITHSLCTLEFEDHRPLYDWVLDTLNTPCHPQQIEFAKFQLDFTVLSKRNLLRMVKENIVNGWDDPRMPTIRGLRRRGVLPESIRNLYNQVGVTKKESVIELATLEGIIRDDLNECSKRAMAVLDPIKVTITNFPEGKIETLSASVHPMKEDWGKREIPFSREIYIDSDDFMMDPPNKYFRLGPGKKVRLRNAYVIQCDEVITHPDGTVKELLCSYDPDTAHGKTPEGQKKVKGIIHWVNRSTALEAEVRLYDRLFTVNQPSADKSKDFTEYLNPLSLNIIKKAYLEPSLKEALESDRFQFERVGYFCLDKDSKTDQLVFNRTITLKDTWSKIK
ncbi:MAG: glutamine--tRNA ligase/YqeY domain fusion protein [Bdellovibrionales bacterium]|nr:glutamine--tRNA ligase/YqeY domain fusion protein [Bdellovibrionales bacterium]